MEKSPDAFRTISEVADYLETPAHVLRFWESRFTQIKPVKRAGGRRYYRPADVALLSGIKRLLHDEGMTIRGVQKILREQGIRHVAALGSEAGQLDQVFAVDESLLDGVTDDPPGAEILAFDPTLRGGGPVEAPGGVTEARIIDPGPAPPPPREAPEAEEEVAEAPFLDADAEPGWDDAPLTGGQVETLHPDLPEEIAAPLPEGPRHPEIELWPEDLPAPEIAASDAPAGEPAEPSTPDGPGEDDAADWRQRAARIAAGWSRPRGSPSPAAPPARSGPADLWSAAGVEAPAPVPPRRPLATALVTDDDDETDSEPVHLLARLAARLRALPAGHEAADPEALAVLRDRLAGLREGIAVAARVRSR